MKNLQLLVKVIYLSYIFCFSYLIKGQDKGFGFYNPIFTECIPKSEREFIDSEIKKSQDKLKKIGLNLAPSNQPVLLDWVLRQRGVNDYSYYGIYNFVDLDNTSGTKDYSCGSRTYDGHQGLDIFPFPFYWDKMDSDNVEIIAGASGIIIYKSDGNFDRRCQWGNNGNWNAVYIQHDDGTVAWYGHMKNGSLTTKAVGQTVSKGEYLGIVGSSGYSTGPHLHLEIRNANNTTIDTYNGSCNDVPSKWTNQKPYTDSKLLKLMTHNVSPNPYPNCNSNPTDIVNEKKNFVSGEIAYFATYYRDQISPQVSTHRIIKPDGTIWQQWTTQATNTYVYSSSYWWQSYFLPSITGTWKFEVDYLGQTYETNFNVNTTLPCPTSYNVINNINNATVKFEAKDVINSNSLIQLQSNITFDSGKMINLTPGFSIDKGNIFKTQIDGCGGN